MNLQRSSFLAIEQDPNKLINPMQKYKDMFGGRGVDHNQCSNTPFINDMDKDLEINFCKPQEVNEMRQLNLVFK